MTERAIRKILVVDNSDRFRSSLVQFLKREGYTCIDLSNASRALSEMDNNQYDLVISAFGMPDMTGIELLESSKKEFPHVEFIIMTDRKDGIKFTDLISAGASDYLIKPFDMEELSARIEKLDRDKMIASQLKAANRKLEEVVLSAGGIAEKAKKGSVAKSEFLADMSHEIRTPLNSIVGFAEMLMETKLGHEQRGYAKTIQSESESLLVLIDDILDFSKIEAGKMGIEEINFDPEVLCHDVCQLIRPKIHTKPVKLSCKIGNGVPSKICGDPLRLRQVLLNLVGNAAKFTDSGEIELSLDTQETTDGKIKLTAVVTDTGIGISKDSLARIFEPFHQARGSVARKYGGTGLGLSICRRIADLMGGDITAESKPEKGSRFCFTAFMKKSDDFDAARAVHVMLPGKKALIAHFGNPDVKALAGALAEKGMETVLSDTRSHAENTFMEAFQEDNPVDIGIIFTGDKKVSGFELATLIRESAHPTSLTPLLALSLPTAGCAKRCEDAGFDAFLTMPVRGHKLVQMTRQIVSIRKDQKDDRRKTRQIMTQYSVREDIKKSVKIIVAEDNLVNQKLVCKMLEKAGYSVKIAENGREAFDLYTFDPNQYDLILMDIQMPEMDGMEATAAIRKWEKSHHGEAKREMHIPVIAVTANAMKEDQNKCLEIGMDDYLSKPIKRELVFEIIEKWVM